MTTTPRNMADCVGIIGAVRLEAQEFTVRERTSGDLTPAGFRKLHAKRAPKWAELVDDAEARATAVVDRRRATVDKLRAAVTAPPEDVNARMLSEMVFARRRHLVDAILEKPGTPGLSDHIAAASPDELPVLVAHIRDAAAAGHPFADTLTATVDEAVDARNPDIAPAVEALSAAERAHENVDLQAEHTRAVLADPDHEVPAYVEGWANSDSFGAADIGV